MKITVSHGKKVPVPGVEYSSREYFVSVEDEIPDGTSGADVALRFRSLLAKLETLVDERIT